MNEIFIVGIPRSGTTWLFSMLYNHEEIEPVLYDDFDSEYQVRNQDGSLRTSETNCFYNYSLEDIGIVYEYKHKEFPDKCLMEKTPDHLYKIPTIKQVFPNSKVIYVQRDPRAVIASLLHTKWFKGPNNIYEAIRYYKTRYNNYLDNKHDVYRIRYEDMRRPKVIKALLNHIGVYAPRAASLMHETEGQAIVKRAYRKTEIDSWRHELTEAEIALIEINCNYIMLEWGYAKS